jgi:hypothetical protein
MSEHTEFLFKKMGEVVAFEQVGRETVKQSEKLLRGSLIKNEIGKVLEQSEAREKVMTEMAEKLGGLETMQGKAEKTGAKLRKLRETYLTDPDDFADVLEWLGFHEGGALTHWILIEGEALRTDDDELKAMAVDGSAGHHRDFALFTGALRMIEE